jgi:hypothetical protein
LKTTAPPSEDEFKAMLAWTGGPEKYEELHSRVLRILVRRQCYESEELWDETVNRVCHLVPTVAPSYVGDPALFFYGVVKLVHLEWLKAEKVKRDAVDNRPAPESGEHLERVHGCLDECLKKLEELNREDNRLILEYYAKDRREKIEHRKRLAADRSLTINTLRMRVHRINLDLKKCINTCMDMPGVDGNRSQNGQCVR